MRIVPGELPVRFDRKFHMSYVGSHAQLLFRSGRSGYHGGQSLRYESVVDILFKNVAAIAVAESYASLEVSLANDTEMERFRQFMNCEIGDRNLYSLRGGTIAGYVLAGALYWVDDPAGSVDESSVIVETPQRSENMVVMGHK